MAPSASSVDEYIASFPADVQVVLQRVREAIRTSTPGTEETIAYGIPVFKLQGRYVVYFAGWKRHVSVYPIPAADTELAKELDKYRNAKGTLQFPLRSPLPYDLISRVAALLMEQREARDST